MAISTPASDTGPMAEMNTTPLIDVMLVLLIMFIITIPVATHSIEVQVPQGKATTLRPDALRNKVVITPDDRILWNGSPIDTAQLAALLAATQQMAIEPELQFEPKGEASYQLTAQVTQIIKASRVTKFGFVGNERYRTFGR